MSGSSKRWRNRRHAIPAGLAPLLLFGLGGCATVPSAAPPVAAPLIPEEGIEALPLQRDVYAFEVSDSAGAPYDHPFYGGLNVPRPQLVDIDGDADLDLFVQERTGEVSWFENQGTPTEPRYVWRSDRYGGLEIGEWYRFVDLDRDGDPDLLTEQPYSYIRYYRNEPGVAGASFVLAADSLRDDEGDALFSDRQNIPNVSDIDCDGHPDLFLGRLDGTVTRYETVEPPGGRDAAPPRFRLVTERFENIEIVAQFGSLHGANTLALTDIDADGDEDLFWGDFFEPGLLYIENRGSCAQPVLTGEPEPFPLDDPLSTSGYNAPAFGDLDGDGRTDLVVGVLGGAYNPNLTTADNLIFLEQGAAGTFTARTSRYLSQIDVGSESLPALADLDGDGDLDLFVANKIDPENLESSRIYEFRNEGTAASPAFRLRGALEIEGLYHYAPAFADLDADGDLDLVLGSWKSEVALLRNVGSANAPRFALADSAIVTLTRGSNTTPALADVDADGDLDLLVGEASGTINFYRNRGTPERPDFALESDEYGGIDVGRRSVPVLLDADLDGDPDLIVGAESGELALFRNVGGPETPEFEPDGVLDLRLPSFATPAFGDLDGDLDIDLIVGGIGGGLRYYRNHDRTGDP